LRVAIIGAGPAGSLLACELAGDGASVAVFDASHPREKPCGGGVTAKALALLPQAAPADPLPARSVEVCRFESGDGETLELRLGHPVAIAARRELDAWLLRRAIAAGAGHVAERVVHVTQDGTVRTASGRQDSFDLIVGADGAGSLVRRTFLAPTPPERLTLAVGWFAPGTSPMTIRFTPGLPGYSWLFPRPDHVGVGICAPLRAVPTRALLSRLEREAARCFPALAADPDGGRYAHTIPSASEDPRSILEIAGARWALVGDAAALCDPITGEGIYYALRSARLLASILRSGAAPARYPEAALEEFGRELLKAAALRARFYRPGFARRMLAYSRRSASLRAILAELVLGEQGYLGLRRRLLQAGPRFLIESALSALLPAA
jgi:flavin-dependent dehydrogenase